MAQNKRRYMILSLLFIAFIAIESKGLAHYDPGDEFTYFYVGKLISEGNMPYRDFFFAHPPLQVFLIAPVLRLLGFNLFALKSIALTSYLISAIFLFKLMKNNFGEAEGVISVILFLFSYSILKEATYFMGMELTTMFMLMGVYYFYNNKSLLGGLLFALAAITGLYSLIPIFVFIISTLIANKKEFVKLVFGFLIIFLVINVLFLLLYGNNFSTPVYKYHLLKPKIEESQKILIFSKIALKNIPLFITSLLFIFIKDKKKISFFVLSALAYLLFLLSLNKIFNFYFVLLIPFLAVISAYSIVRLYKTPELKNIKRFFMLMIAILFLYLLSVNALNLLNLDFVNFKSLNTISNFVVSNSGKEDSIFGDATITPMIALYTDRKIAFNLVDTNEMVYQSGVVSLESTINSLREGDVKFVIIKPLYGIGRFKLLNDYLDTECRLAKWVKDFYWGDFLIYDCSKSG